MISVIIPIYNSEKWLKKCLDSVLGQTYEDLEIILVNDGSTDNSITICNVYARVDSRIKVIHQQNAGALKARWNALSIARGEWISFVDSDDWIEPKMYAEMLSIAEENTDIIWCGVKMELSNNTQQDYHIKFKSDTKYLTQELLKGKIPGWSCNKLIKRSLLNDRRIDMENADMMMEDVLLSVQLFALKPQIKYIDKPFYHYNRQNENAVTAQNAAKIYRKAQKNIQLIYDFLISHKLYPLYRNAFNTLAMRFKIAEASNSSIRDAKKIFPFAHKNMSSMPLQTSVLKCLYWFYFNTGAIGEKLYSITHR